MRDTNPFLEYLPDDSELKVSRTYKDSLFRFIFAQSKEYALSLYNAVNGSSYTNVDDLEFITLESAFFIKMRNDAAFVFDKTLSLYEHQSTYNPNMPLRGLFYFADLYRKILTTSDLYSSSRIMIPTPQYIVFYNGTDRKNVPENIQLKLSDSFMTSENTTRIYDSKFEWTATMININSGHNQAIMDSCSMLDEYSKFIETVRKFSCNVELKGAIIMAIDECLKEGILTDFLSTYRWEVAAMAWGEFDEKEYYDVVKKESYQEGYDSGYDSGHKEGIKLGREEEHQKTVQAILELDAINKKYADATAELNHLKGVLAQNGITVE